MPQFDYDIIIIGAGSGGISAANLAVNLGKKTALVEIHRIGGECTWSGCVPSKALIKSAEIAHGIQNAESYGLKLPSAGQLDSSKVMQHVRDIIARVYKEEKPEVFQNKGIDVFIKEPVFLDAHHIQVSERILSAAKFVISTGSHPFVPPIEGIDSVDYLTNENLFELETLPESMIIVGGGPIGSEMASALNRLGVKITIIEMTDHILSREDDELAEMLMDKMMEEGVEVSCHSRAIKVEKNQESIRLHVQSERHGDHTLDAASLLLAVGRRPNIDGLNLEKAGIETNQRGIVVDKTMRTTAKNIYAIGDVAGSYQFSHMAEYWAGIAVPNAVLPIPIKKKANYEHVPWSTFTDPELARSGVTEKEAIEKFGDSIRVYRYPFSGVDRAKTDLLETGLVKIITTRKGKILGIHVLGAHASDLMHEVLLAKTLGLTFDKIMQMIHAYPTYSDAVKRPSARFYADKLRDNFFIKLIQKLRK